MFDSATVAAVRAFQTAEALGVDARKHDWRAGSTWSWPRHSTSSPTYRTSRNPACCSGT
ncbi:peptidoglycan-binding domain-containing protein [Amycolatopsis japonica]